MGHVTPAPHHCTKHTVLLCTSPPLPMGNLVLRQWYLQGSGAAMRLTHVHLVLPACSLQEDDRVLIAEACNHNRITEMCNDIGMVQVGS